MANNDDDAKKALFSITERYSSIQFQKFTNLRAEGSVFLKANQKNGIVYIRSENGLGQGILLTCQYNDQTLGAQTYGPFPLTFFALNWMFYGFKSFIQFEEFIAGGINSDFWNNDYFYILIWNHFSIANNFRK